MSQSKTSNEVQGKAESQAKHKTGFTLIEILIVIAILSVLFGISIQIFSSMTKAQSLDKDVENVYSALLRARNQTINGESGSNYGIYFASSSVTSFRGTTYTPEAAGNEVFLFANKTYISSTNLTGGVVDMYFKKISGQPTATGTIVFKISTDSSLQKTILINGTGLVEVQ